MGRIDAKHRHEGPGRDGGDVDVDLRDRDEVGGPRIRCPRCRWQPRAYSRWSCRCGHVWNTFDTAGLCPACGYQWLWTACPACHVWSPHRDWYEDPDG